MIDGILNINKPQGVTSHDVVRDIRRLLGVKKIGHTGTLDPMATGVLPICIGKATRITEYTDLDFKKYRCQLRLGTVTDTQDIWGTVLEQHPTDGITEEAVRKAFEGFRGRISQRPPMYSAVRIAGRRLYDYARAGETVEVKTREVYINDLVVEAVDFGRTCDRGAEIPDPGCAPGLGSATAPAAPRANPQNTSGGAPAAPRPAASEPVSGPRVRFTVECSKGTYIRTICEDVGRALGCGAVMESLERLASGAFRIEDAIDLYDLTDTYATRRFEGEKYFVEQASPENLARIEKLILPIDYPLVHFGKAVMSAEQAHKFIDGWHVPLSECVITERPEFESADFPLEIRPEYRAAYNMYRRAGGTQNAAPEFIGVAFYSPKYKKLVADKVFARNDE